MKMGFYKDKLRRELKNDELVCVIIHTSKHSFVDFFHQQKHTNINFYYDKPWNHFNVLTPKTARKMAPMKMQRPYSPNSVAV